MKPDCGNCYEIADEKSSYILQKLRNLAEGQCNDAVLKTLFLEQLSDNLRNILAICEDTDLTRLAQLADKVFETSKPNVTQVDIAAKASPIKNATTSCGCAASINELTRQVRELCEIRDRDRSSVEDLLDPVGGCIIYLNI